MLKGVTIERLRNHGFSLILSGGSALGIAHIGVIKWLEENSLIPDEIIGASMGSVIGALYACGYSSSQITKIVEELGGINLFNVKYSHGIFEHRRINVLLKKIFRKKRMRDSNIKLKIITTELISGDPKVFSSEDSTFISEVVRASISIPGIFKVKKIRNRNYIDGGVSSNLPIEFAKKNNLKIASNVINHGRNIKIIKPHGFFSAIRARISMIEYSMHYLIRNQTYSKTPYIKKLLLIEPQVNDFSLYRLERYPEMIEIGYKEAKKRIKK